MSETTGARILSILDLFTEAKLVWTPEEIMHELGFSRPTVYRYVSTLRDAGMLVSRHGAGLSLGPRMVELDWLMRQSDPLVVHGQPILTQLVGVYPAAALIVRFHGDRLLCIAAECGVGAPSTSYARGRPMPLARGAISKAVLAWLPPRVQKPIIRANLAELRSVGLGETTRAIQASLAEVHRRGVAIAHGEVTPGVCGIAVPVLEHDAPIAALAMTITDSAVREGSPPGRSSPGARRSDDEDRHGLIDRMIGDLQRGAAVLSEHATAAAQQGGVAAPSGADGPPLNVRTPRNSDERKELDA